MYFKYLVSIFAVVTSTPLLLRGVSAFQGMGFMHHKPAVLKNNPSLSSSTLLFSSEVTSAPNKIEDVSLDSTNNSNPSSSSSSRTASNFKSNQPKYGKELDLPETYVRCGRCFTNYAITEEDLGTGRGRRVECALCSHSWFQTPERLFTLNQGHQLVPLPETEISRIHSNVENGREPDFVGNAKFYVGNLDFGVQEDDLRKVFQEIGQVGGVSIVTDPNGRSRGFAFVTMMDEEVTDKCMDLDGTELMGRNINVKAPNN